MSMPHAMFGGSAAAPSLNLRQSMAADAGPGDVLSNSVVIDLLKDLKEAKQDATWAKNKLAEMILLMNKKSLEEGGLDGINLSNSGIDTKKAVSTTSGRYSQQSKAQEVEESADEYSNDFEESAEIKGSVSPVLSPSRRNKKVTLLADARIKSESRDGLRPTLAASNEISSSLRHSQVFQKLNKTIRHSKFLIF